MTKSLKYSGILIVILYVIFLAVPFFITDTSYLVEKIKLNTDFRLTVEDAVILTSPKLTAGIGAKHVEVSLADGETFLTADNVRIDLFVLPLIFKKVELDMISAENLNLNLKIKKDGSFLIKDYMLPAPAYNLKFSKNMPDVYVNNYNISFISIPSDKTFSLYGNNLSIRDFIQDKKIKISADGKLMSAKLNAIINTDTKIVKSKKGLKLDGYTNISDFSVAVNGKQLPASNLDLNFKRNNIAFYGKLYSSGDEVTELLGSFSDGIYPKADLNCKSNLRLKSAAEIIKSIGEMFDYDKFGDLKASGVVDADFSIKTNFDEIESSGYLKINSASVNYELFNIAANNINADVDLSNSLINIKKAEVTLAGHTYHFGRDSFCCR